MVVNVNADNVEELGFFCVQNKKHPGYRAKHTWLTDRFREGLKIKMILTPERKPAGFIEYIPAEHTWRVVDAPGYLVVHCIWVNSRKSPAKGSASTLLSDALKDARSGGHCGLAVVTSDGPWMAGREVFLRNGFVQVDEAPPHYQLLVRKSGKAPDPVFPGDWDKRLAKIRGLRLLYSNQCPYVGKAVNELPPVAKKFGAKLVLEELKDARKARDRMPTPYGVVSLVFNGRMLADHPISATRFANILTRDLNLKTAN